MDSFVFKEVNKASREYDISKIEFYGPFAMALGYVVQAGDGSKKGGVCEGVKMLWK